MAKALEDWQGHRVLVLTNDGRVLTGVLRGFDQVQNLVLAQCQERVFSRDTGVELEPLGLYIVRGDNVAVIGQVDAELDTAQDLAGTRAAPPAPIIH